MAIKIHQIYGNLAMEKWLVKSKRCERNPTSEQRRKVVQIFDCFLTREKATACQRDAFV
jgi:hypothetical protein